MGTIQGSYHLPLFMDSDIYKWLEAVGYELYHLPDADLQRKADSAIVQHGVNAPRLRVESVMAPRGRGHPSQDGARGGVGE